MNKITKIAVTVTCLFIVIGCSIFLKYRVSFEETIERVPQNENRSNLSSKEENYDNKSNRGNLAKTPVDNETVTFINNEIMKSAIAVSIGGPELAPQFTNISNLEDHLAEVVRINLATPEELINILIYIKYMNLRENSRLNESIISAVNYYLDRGIANKDKSDLCLSHLNTILKKRKLFANFKRKRDLFIVSQNRWIQQSILKYLEGSKKYEDQKLHSELIKIGETSTK